MEKIYSRTKTIQEDKVSGFCPGCMHSTVIKLIGEVLDEMNLVDRAASVLGIGCCGLHMDYIAYDTTTAPHGRACAVAAGVRVVVIDSDVDSKGVSVRIGTDNITAGRMSGEAALKTAQEKIVVGIVNAYAETQNCREREQGFREVLLGVGRV